jgi:hypothetical protein
MSAIASSVAAEHRQGSAPDAATFALLRERGVPLPALVRSAAGALDPVVSDTVVFLDGGTFEFARHARGGEAERALLIPARDTLDDLSDIVAWSPETGRITSWLGRARLLGEEQLAGFRLDDDAALTVHADLFAWLADMRRGVVVVDPRRAGPGRCCAKRAR